MREKVIAIVSSAVGFITGILWYFDKIGEPLAVVIGSAVALSLAVFQILRKEPITSSKIPEDRVINIYNIDANTDDFIQKIKLEILKNGDKAVNTSFWNNSNTIFLRWISFIPVSLTFVLITLLYGWLLYYAILIYGTDAENWFRGTEEFQRLRGFLVNNLNYQILKAVLLILVGLFLIQVFIFWRKTSKLIGVLTFTVLQICPDNKFGVSILKYLCKGVFYLLVVLTFFAAAYYFFFETDEKVNLIYKLIGVVILSCFFLAPIWVSYGKINSVLELSNGIEPLDYNLLFKKFREIDDTFDDVFGDVPFYPTYKI